MTFMQDFVRSQGKPIVRDGRTIHWTCYVPVRKGDVVRFRFRTFVREPVQGLAIDCDHCKGQIIGKPAKKYELWTDTAPEVVDVRIVEARANAALAIFNVWGDHTHSPMLYRLNDAGIDVQQEDDAVVLHCSDGVGPPTFDDLIVEVTRISSTPVTTA
jgi:uncharacterized protein